MRQVPEKRPGPVVPLGTSPGPLIGNYQFRASAAIRAEIISVSRKKRFFMGKTSNRTGPGSVSKRAVVHQVRGWYSGAAAGLAILEGASEGPYLDCTTPFQASKNIRGDRLKRAL
jgi:hypothetical protein